MNFRTDRVVGVDYGSPDGDYAVEFEYKDGKLTFVRSAYRLPPDARGKEAK